MVVTDLSALRVLDGQVPYRDFWTMYAPGSIYAAAAGYALFGRELLVGHLLGAATATAAVLALQRLLLRVAAPWMASLAALLFAVAFFHTGYQNQLSSYPPSILCIWLAAGRIAEHARRASRLALHAAGLLLGLAIVFKHDLGGYASLALAATLLLDGAGPGAVARVAATALAVVSLPLAALLAAGAGPDLLEDLVVFPLTRFRHVRSEFFPLLPRVGARASLENARALVFWASLNLPSLALATGAVRLWPRRRGLAPEAASTLRFAVCFYPLVWCAAHVQINTHLVTLTGLGALVAAAGLAPRAGAPAPRRVAQLALAAAALWALALLAEPAERLRRAAPGGFESAGLPGLAGIVVPRADARWMRGLAEAVERAAPPDAPVLLVGARNDVLIYASPRFYWLTRRRPVTRHHELHPGVTDTDAVQRQMLADLAAGPLPVVVREHRFDDAALDAAKAHFLAAGVPVGTTRLDDWIARHYEPRPGRAGRFDIYQVLRLRRAADASPAAGD